VVLMPESGSRAAIRASVAAVTDSLAIEIGELALSRGVSPAASAEMRLLLRQIENAEGLLALLLFRASEIIRLSKLGSQD
jgi:hypothetical protein